MPTQFKIVTTAYNCADYIGRSLSSLESQSYPHYQACVVDDASTDSKMHPIIRDYCERNGWTAVFNTENRGGMATMVQAIEALDCNPDDVIVILDGDDWLFNETVLERVAKVYEEGDVWLTYGQHVRYRKGNLGCAAPLKPRWIRKRIYRKKRWLFTHLRTFKAFLWNEIRPEDLRDPEGNYWKATSDMATMFPMIEMAGNHFRFLPDIHYVYNDGNPLCDQTAHSQIQRDCERLIRAMPPYSVLER